MKRSKGLGWTSRGTSSPPAPKDSWEGGRPAADAASPTKARQQQQPPVEGWLRSPTAAPLQQPTSDGPLRSSLHNNRYKAAQDSALPTSRSAGTSSEPPGSWLPHASTTPAASPASPAAAGTGGSRYPVPPAPAAPPPGGWLAGPATGSSSGGRGGGGDTLTALAASAAGALLSHPNTAAAAGALVSAAAGLALQQATAPPLAATQQQRPSLGGGTPAAAPSAAAVAGRPPQQQPRPPGAGLPPRSSSPDVSHLQLQQQQRQQQLAGTSFAGRLSGGLSAAASWLRLSRSSSAGEGATDGAGQPGSWWGGASPMPPVYPDHTPTRRNLAALARADPSGPLLLAPDGGAMPGPSSVLAAGPAGSPALAAQQAAVVALRGLLLWRHPAASGAALAGGAYLIVLVACIPTAVQYLQPTTALSAGGLALMAYAGVKPYLLHYGAAAARTPKPQLAARWEALEAGLLARVYGVGCALVQLAWCGGTAAAWLAQRALLGRSFTTSAFSAAALWVLLLISELRVFGQLLPVLLAWGSLFLVPWLLHQFRRCLDGVVEDALHVTSALVLAAPPASNALAAGLGVAAWAWMAAEGINWVVCASVSGGVSLGYLAWSAVRR